VPSTAGDVRELIQGLSGAKQLSARAMPGLELGQRNSEKLQCPTIAGEVLEPDGSGMQMAVCLEQHLVTSDWLVQDMQESSRMMKV
jgi:hypothetical protein